VKEIKADSYSIWIGETSLSKLDITNYSMVAILVDENTKRECLSLLPKINNSIIIEVPSGEAKKNISTCNTIWEKLSINNFDRNSVLINLGGGVIGDMGGFCAASYKRGIDFIQIPTTLLAMVDASIGGKIGINFNGLKNQIGLFSNPKSVIINPIFLKTLSRNQLQSGFAEVIKHSLITNKKHWEILSNTSFKDLDWQHIIDISIQIKNTIVKADPLEKNNRKKLNFGHTYGHAIESYYLEEKKPILHGESVLMGIILECELSLLSQNEKIEIKNYLIKNFQLPDIPSKNKLMKFLINDKKNKEAKINFTLLNGIGNCTIDNLFTEDEL
jgi:3-dehydroquinate synthase